MRFSPLRYAIYTRQSTASSVGKELSSCEVQYEMCRDFMRGTRPGTHPAVISEALFEQARQQVAARRKLGKKAKAPAKRHALFWSLRGKVFCPACGRAMSTHVTQKENTLFRHYRCRSFSGGRPPCKGSAFPAYDLERIASDLIGKMQFQEMPAGATGVDRDTFRRFQEMWAALNENARDRLLPKVVRKVSFDQNRSKLRIETDDAEILAFVGR